MGFDESGGSALSNGPGPIHPCATWVSLEPSAVLYYAFYLFYTPSVCIKLDKPEDDVAKVTVLSTWDPVEPSKGSILRDVPCTG